MSPPNRGRSHRRGSLPVTAMTRNACTLRPRALAGKPDHMATGKAAGLPAARRAAGMGPGGAHPWPRQQRQPPPRQPPGRRSHRPAALNGRPVPPASAPPRYAPSVPSPAGPGATESGPGPSQALDQLERPGAARQWQRLGWSTASGWHYGAIPGRRSRTALTTTLPSHGRGFRVSVDVRVSVPPGPDGGLPVTNTEFRR